MRMSARFLCCLAIVLGAAHTSPAAQKSLDRRDVFPAAENKRLLVDVADLDVTVRLADVTEIEAEVLLHIANTGDDAAQRWIDNHTPDFTDSREQLRIIVSPGKSGFLGFGRLSARARLNVLVPGMIVPEITTSTGNIQLRGDFPNARPLRLRSLSGDMTMIGAAGSLHVDGGEGDVQIDVIRPLDEFFARTSSGDVRLAGGSRASRVDTGSGTISLTDLSGGVEASTSNGRITIQWNRLEAGQRVRIRSALGRVHLEIPADTRPQGRLTTTTGNIRSEFPGLVTEDGSTLQLQGDGPEFDVETASGQIQLVMRDGWD